MKRRFSLFLTLCLIMTFLPFTVSAADTDPNAPINGFFYDKDTIVLSDFVNTPSDMEWRYYEKDNLAEGIGLGATVKSPWDPYAKNTSYTLSFTINSKKDFTFSLGYALSASETSGYVAVDDTKYIELATKYVSMTRCVSDTCAVPLAAGSHTVTVNFTTTGGDNGNRSAYLYDLCVCTSDHKANVGTVIEPTCTADGYAEHFCPTCGFSWIDEKTEHLGHQFENGICIRCGGIEMKRDTDGTYLISSAAQLDDFARIVNEGEYTANAKLTADIVYNQALFDENGAFDEQNMDTFAYFTPIGFGDAHFSGTFDGNGHTIYGLYIYSKEATIQYKPESTCLAFISSADGAVIRNLTIQDSYIRGSQYLAGICAKGIGRTKIQNCSVLSSEIYGAYYSGGICATLFNGSIFGCHNNASVTAMVERSGGILSVPGSDGTVVESCLNTGFVHGGSSGGIVGMLEKKMTIRNCLSVGSVTGSNYVGNILGFYRNAKFEIENCAYPPGTGTAVGGGMNSYGYTVDATAYSSSFLASGKVAYLLNGDQSEIAWYQTIGTDRYPVLDPSHKTVYFYRGGYSNTYCPHTETKSVHYDASCATEGYDAVICTNCLIELSKSNIVPQLGDHDYGEKTRICTICGDGEVPLGDGTNDSPFQIANHGNLLWLSQYYNHTLKSRAVPNERTTYAELTADIDMRPLNNRTLRPIGTDTDRFIGVFEGNGYKIDHLNVSASENASAGLFGTITNAQLRNFTLVRATVKGKSYAGAVVGYVKGSSDTNDAIYNVHVKSSVINGTNRVGGLVGHLERASVSRCSVNGITAKTDSLYCGGLVGYIFDGEIRDCLAVSPTLSAESEGCIGGVAGYNGGIVKNCAAYLTGAYKYTDKPNFQSGIVARGSDSIGSYYYSSTDTTDFRKDGTEKDARAFQLGEVCFLLNNGVADGTQAWYQNLTNEITTRNPEPIFKEGGTVYKINPWNYSNTPAIWYEINDKTVTIHNLVACGYEKRATLLLSADGSFIFATVFDNHPLELSSRGIRIEKKTAIKAFLWYDFRTAKPITASYSTTVSPQKNS